MKIKKLNTNHLLNERHPSFARKLSFSCHFKARRLFLIIGISCIPEILFAQLVMPLPQQTNQVNFQQQLDVFDWRYLVGYGGQNGSSSYAIGIDFKTSMTQRSDGNRWKDHQSGFLTFSHIFNTKATLLSRLLLTNFYDELSAFNFDRKQVAATLAGVWRPAVNVQLQPEIGYRWEIRPDFDERGPYGAISFSANDFELSGYKNNASGLAEITRFPARKNANARINYTVFREFQPGTWDSLSVFYDYFRRDNFFSNPTQGNIESLRKEQRGLANTLQYRINERVAVVQHTAIALGSVAVQQVDQLSKGARRAHDDYNFTSHIHLTWSTPKISGLSEFETTESSIKYNIPDSIRFSPISRRFASIGYDLTEKKTKISQKIQYRPNRNNELQFSLELAKIQHDNSDTTNNDSYDEQRWQFSLEHLFKINNALSVGWQLSAFVKHFVYLDGKLSSQNNWARLLQLQPVLVYNSSDGIQFHQKVGVRTQYVDFDFGDNFSQTRSYVIRDFYISDSLALPVSRQVDLSLHYRLEFEELGSLNWDAFTSRPRTKWQNHWFGMLLTQEFRWPLRLSFGTVFYMQKRWQFRSAPGGGLVSEPVGTQLNVGPVVRLVYQGSDGSVIYFSGQRQRVSPFQGDPYFISHIQLSVQWTF
jgi:hypothetical protein